MIIKIMKRFWNLILAISVIFGTVACTEEGGFILGNYTDSFSFIAVIDHTRADIVDNDGAWQTVWSGDDTLYVTSDKGNFSFTNSVEEPSRFVATEAEASVLRTATNIVITTQHENGSVVDSDAGKRGLCIRGEYEEFPKSGKVSLGIQSAFFRLACDSDVTILTDDAIFSGINGDCNLENNITLKAGDDIWVAVTPCVEKTSITAIVADKEVMSAQNLALKPCVIYNLGKIEPESENSIVYLVPNNEWRSSGAWFAAYLWSDNGEVSVKLTDEDGDGIYSTAIPQDMTNIIFCRMNPAYREFAWSSVWAQTADLTVGIAPNNYFYITGANSGEWGSAGYNPNHPNEEPSKWAVAGSYNGWSSDDVMYTTEEENIFVTRGLTINAGDKFKIKSVGSWDIDFGGGVTNLMPNVWMVGVYKGSSIMVAKSGIYDIYFDSVNEFIYLMEEGVHYTNAIEQTNNGENSETSDISWGLCGTHNDWGRDGNKDYVLTWDQTIGLYVAYNVTLTGEFKVRADNSWGNDYGSNGWVYFDDYYGAPMTKSGGNCICVSGTYDVYFDLSNALIWVRTPGSEAPINQ